MPGCSSSGKLLPSVARHYPHFCVSSLVMPVEPSRARLLFFMKARYRA